MTREQLATALITFILGGGLMLTIQRGVKAYRDVKGGRLADTGSVVDRLEKENVRLTATVEQLRVRLDAAELEVEKESAERRREQLRSARLELQLVRAGLDPEGGRTE